MAGQAAASSRPNIVMFLVDDMGWQDTSEPFWSERTPFNERYRTPNMERLARTGMKFTQAYACAVCSPTRVSLLTGQNAARHRVTNWTLHKDRAQDAASAVLEFPRWNVNGISQQAGVERAVYAKCLPTYLQEAGYRTIHVGKAHFGALGTPGADPLNLGFDVNIAGHAAGGPGSYLSEQGFSAQWRGGDAVWDIPGLAQYHDSGVFLTEALTREANRAVTQALASEQPFFLYMSHYAVHVPDSRCDDYLIIEDFFPTLLEMAGSTASYNVDGESFVPLLRGGAAAKERPLFWHYPNNWGPSGPGIGSYSAIRKGAWKLIYYHEPDRAQRYELFNIEADIGERANRAAAEPQLVEQLGRELSDFLLEVEAQMPIDLATKRPVSLPGQ